MIVFPVPTTLDTLLLEDQLEAANLPSGVYVDGSDLVLGNLDESDRTAAQTVLDAHPAKAQAEAQRVAGERTNESTIRDRAGQALAANLTFLAAASPTNAQVVAQVKALTRQNNGLIRLVLNRFDGTD